MNKDTETRGFEWSANDEEGTGDDRLRRVVHAALAIYLLPALVVVMAVGGVMVVATEAAKAARRVANSLGWAAVRVPAAAGLPRRVKPPLVDRSGGGLLPEATPNVHAAQRSRGPSARS